MLLGKHYSGENLQPAIWFTTGQSLRKVMNAAALEKVHTQVTQSGVAESGDNGTKAGLICSLLKFVSGHKVHTHTLDTFPVTFSLPLNLSNKVRVKTPEEEKSCWISNKQHNIREARVRDLQNRGHF